jgi:hypothetical protein
MSSTARRILALSLSLTFVAGLTACSQAPDPAQTLEQFSAVTEAPVEADPEDEFNVDTHPEPFVEPLACSPYLVVTARGSGEPHQGQLLSPVVRAISEARPEEVQSFDLDYPADDNVKLGSTAGVRLLIDTLNVQSEHCPLQRFVVLGYSQGALVTGDALASPEDRLVGQTVGEISAEASERILAVVLYANPRFVGGEPYAAGTFDPAVNGILPRSVGSLVQYEQRMRDYCEAGDFVCQTSLSLDPEQHLAYFDNGTQLDGAAFVISQLDPLNVRPNDPPVAAESR